MFENDIDDLIGKVLAGEASAEEQLRLDSWCRDRDENRRYFEQTKEVFDRAAAIKIQVNFDTDKAWQKVKQQLHSRREGAGSTSRSVNFWPAVRIAAGLALLISASVWIYIGLEPKNVVKVVADITT